MSEWEFMLRISALFLRLWVNCCCVVCMRMFSIPYGRAIFTLQKEKRKSVRTMWIGKICWNEKRTTDGIGGNSQDKRTHGKLFFVEIPKKSFYFWIIQMRWWVEVGSVKEQCNLTWKYIEVAKKLNMKVWWDFDKQLRKTLKDVEFSICIFQLELCHISHVEEFRNFHHTRAIFHTKVQAVQIKMLRWKHINFQHWTLRS